MSRRLPPPLSDQNQPTVDNGTERIDRSSQAPPRHPSISRRNIATEERAATSTVNSTNSPKTFLPPPRHPTIPRTPSPKQPRAVAQDSSRVPPASLSSIPIELLQSDISVADQDTDTFVVVSPQVDTLPLIPTPNPVDGDDDALAMEFAGMDAAALKKKVEVEEIERYLIAFGKHVHHLRVPSTTSSILPILPKPKIPDYTFSKIAGRKAEFKGFDVKGFGNIGLDTSKDSEDSGGDTWAFEDIDWMAYAAAYSRYLFGPPIPLEPLEPFTIARLRSNAERLYVVAKPTWEGFGKTIANICLWKNKAVTGMIAATYLLLVFTSTLLPVLFLLPLYTLLKYRFFPPSPPAQYKAALAAEERSQEAAELVDEISQDQLGLSREDSGWEGTAYQPGRGFGVGLDFGRANEGLGLGRAGVAVDGLLAGRGNGSNSTFSEGHDQTPRERNTGKDEGEGEAETKGKKPKREKKRLQKWIKGVEAEYGAGMVVVLGDLADLHEKVKNLYLWRSPNTSTTFAVILLTLASASYVTPLWLLVKLVELALGAVAFIVIPLIAAQERYEPMSWMAGNAPTDADYAMQLIRARAAAGEPLVIHQQKSKVMGTETSSPVSASTLSLPSSNATRVSKSTTEVKPATSSRSDQMVGSEKKKGVDWERLKVFGGKGAKLLETSRQIASGEREFKVGFSPGGSMGESVGLLPPNVSSLTQLRLGSHGPGLVFTQHNKGIVEGGAESIPYFTQYGRTPGHLLISSEKIIFRPLLPDSTKSKCETKEIASTSTSLPSAVAVDITTSPIPPERSIEIPMDEVVGIRKRDKTSLLVVVAAGLEIECSNRKTVSFPLVSNRDQAFHRLLALSTKSFAKV